jgi:signal peptidase I
MEEDETRMSHIDHHNQPKIRGNHFRITDFLSTFLVVVVAFVLAFALITYVFQSYQVDGPSMENTLQNNDRLIVWKVARTWGRVTGHPYTPNRGDIIIFNESGLAAYGQTNTKQLIKRVIGLPGDRVVVQDGKITIYNRNHPKGFDPDTTLPYGKAHSLPYTQGDINITLGKDQIFVCGDNRTDSLDSRIFGPVNVNNIIGKLVLRIYPFNSFMDF